MGPREVAGGTHLCGHAPVKTEINFGNTVVVIFYSPFIVTSDVIGAEERVLTS